MDNRLYSILAIDDSENNLNLLNQILTFNNFKVYIAANSYEALVILKSFLPDLILLDLMMPDIDGFELLKKLKMDKQTNAIPVIVVTARTDDRDRYECMSHGAADFVTKPILIDDLLNRIAKVLGIDLPLDEA